MRKYCKLRSIRWSRRKTRQATLKMLDYLKGYASMNSVQETQHLSVFIYDILYFLGVSLDAERYTFPQEAEKFQSDLREFLRIHPRVSTRRAQTKALKGLERLLTIPGTESAVSAIQAYIGVLERNDIKAE